MAKKEKIVWVDDGRTVADMSQVPGSTSRSSGTRYSGSMKEKLLTLLDAMGFMLLPTLALVGLLAAAFAIVYILL